jgi:hypothetical protein
MRCLLSPNKRSQEIAFHFRRSRIHPSFLEGAGLWGLEIATSSKVLVGFLRILRDSHEGAGLGVLESTSIFEDVGHIW